jgi:hypothetical protein
MLDIELQKLIIFLSLSRYNLCACIYVNGWKRYMFYTSYSTHWCFILLVVLISYNLIFNRS